MSEITSDIKALQHQADRAREFIAHRDTAERLAKNPDFQKLFNEEYFVKEAARLVQLAGDPALTLEQRNDALEMAKATGHTKRYLAIIIQMGAHADKDLQQAEETIEELRALGEDE